MVCAYEAPGVDYARFGNEGTGARTLTPFAWQLGVKYHFAIREDVRGKWLRYTCWFGDGSTGSWTKIAALDCPVQTRGLTGLYSFCEDFRRDGYDKEHRCVFGPCCAYEDGSAVCHKSAHCTFTAASEEGNNINATAHERGFSLCTGGPVKQMLELNKTLNPVCALQAPSIPAAVHGMAVVTDAFQGENPGEIDLRVGEHFHVLHEGEDGWWEVQNGRATGFAPGSFLQYRAF